MKPRSRKAGLIVRELEGELLVYDVGAHRAHRLNRTAAALFRACDGRRSLPQLVSRLRRELGVPADARWVRLGVARLGKAGLIDGEPGAKGAPDAARRELVRRAGLALLLPIVTSIVAPTPAEAAATCVTDCSSATPGTPCHSGNPGDCGTTCVCGPLGTCVQVLDLTTPC